MYEKVKQAKRVIDIFLITYTVINAILILLFFIKYGFGQGVYRLITIGIGNLLTYGLLSSVKDGNLFARIISGLLFIGTAIFASIFIKQKNSSIVYLAILILLAIVYFSLGIFILFSSQVNSIRKYNKVNNELKWLWNWSGNCIGYFDKGYLWDEKGEVIGKFVDNELYSLNGSYIGERYLGNDRLCIDESKLNKQIETYEMADKNYKFDPKPDISSMKIYNKYIDFNVIIKVD